MKNTTAMADYELRHIEALRKDLAGCTVLLKKDGSFPLEKPCTLAAYGSGVRRTIRGGTGSGEVNSRYIVTIEEGLQQAGFTLTGMEWHTGYEQAREKAHKAFLKQLKKDAKAAKQNFILYGMGKVMPEPEYDLPLNAEGDAAIYVVSRISGEGNDRTPLKGDIRLTDSEVRDILALDKKFTRFMLVLNVGGVVDLSPVMGVRNILLLSQLGVETGGALADILLGKDQVNSHGTPDARNRDQLFDELRHFFLEFGKFVDDDDVVREWRQRRIGIVQVNVVVDVADAEALEDRLPAQDLAVDRSQRTQYGPATVQVVDQSNDMRKVAETGERAATLVVNQNELKLHRRILHGEREDNGLQKHALAGTGRTRNQAMRPVRLVGDIQQERSGSRLQAYIGLYAAACTLCVPTAPNLQLAHRAHAEGFQKIDVSRDRVAVRLFVVAQRHKRGKGGLPLFALYLFGVEIHLRALCAVVEHAFSGDAEIDDARTFLGQSVA